MNTPSTFASKARKRAYDLLVCLPSVLLYMVDALGTIDLTPLFAAFGLAEFKDAFVTGYAVLAIPLRFYLYGVPFKGRSGRGR